MEDQEDRELLGGLELLAHKVLVHLEKLRVELNIARFVHTVHVTEGGRDTEVGSDLAELAVDVPDVLGLGVEGRVVDVLVVNTVLLTASDTDFHLKPHTNLGHALKVLLADSNVLLLALFREVKHVRREERLLVLLEVLLVGSEHAIEPREQLLGTVVRVQNDGDTVRRSNRADVLGSSDSTSDRSLLLVVGQALAGEVRRTTLRELQDNGRFRVAGSLKSRVRDRRCLVSLHSTYRHIERRDGKVMLTSVVEDFVNVVARNNAGGNNVENTHGNCDAVRS